MVFACLLVFSMTEKEITIAATTIAAVSATHSTVTSPSSRRAKQRRPLRIFCEYFLTGSMTARLSPLSQKHKITRFYLQQSEDLLGIANQTAHPAAFATLTGARRVKV